MMPFMASGRLVKDYKLLMKYFEKLRELGLDASRHYPTSQDIEVIKRGVERGEIKSVAEALNILVQRFKERIDPVIAKKAFEECMGVEVDEATAVNEVAKLLAYWTLEMSEGLGLIKLVGTEVIR